MRRAVSALFILITAFLGFAFGRVTAERPVLGVSGTRSFPVPPSPPASAPFGDDSAGDAKRNIPEDLPIILETPVDGAVSDGLLAVSGRAKRSVGSVAILVKNAAGSVLKQTEAAVIPGESDYGRFAATFHFDPGTEGDATVEVSGSLAGTPMTIARAVRFMEASTVEVKVFWNRAPSDAEQQCGAAHTTSRFVSSETAIYRAVIEALAEDPNDQERAEGYATALPANVKLKSIAGDAAGTVTADFTDSLERRLSGSCRLAAVRAQIVNTLKQFPEVRDVVISVNGRSEGVLEP